MIFPATVLPVTQTAPEQTQALEPATSSLPIITILLFTKLRTNSHYYTVFQAELTDLMEACNYLTNTSNKYIIIWTDSLFSIEAVTTLSIRSRTTRSCYEALNTLGTKNKLELR
jgi:hypothetical protein